MSCLKSTFGIIILSAIILSCGNMQIVGFGKPNHLPYCKIIYPSKGQTFSKTSGFLDIIVHASDISGNIYGVQLSVNNKIIVLLTNVEDPYRFSWDFTGVEPGIYKIKAIAIDNDGNKRSRQVSINIQD